MAVKIEKLQLPHGTFYMANGLPISEEIISFALKHSTSVEAFFEEFNKSQEVTIYGFIANKEMDLEGVEK